MAARPFSNSTSDIPSRVGRRTLLRLCVAAVILIMGMVAACTLYGYRVLLRSALGGGFTRVTDFPLRDSLPALEGGLSNLEAFKAAISPAGKADADRSLWISDSIGTLHLEYVSEKQPFDSVVFLTWVTDGSLDTRTFYTREAAWDQMNGRSLSGWSEVVAAYASFPAMISLKSADSTITLFEPAEGKVFHVVEGWYLDRQEPVLAPDTVYPAPATGDEVLLMVRGGALAVVNPSPQTRTLRLLSSGERESVIVRSDSSSVSLYRSVMRGRVPPVLAYSDPGKTIPVFRGASSVPPQFFVWWGASPAR